MKNQDLLAALAKSRWLFPPDPTPHSDNYDLKCAEPIIHEIAHAVTLGLSIDNKVPDRVSDAFEEINNRSCALGLIHEAHCFAVERKVLHRLGWLRHFRLTKLMDEVYRIGFSGPALPKPLFLKIYRIFSREEQCDVLASKAIDILREIASMK